MQASRAFDLPCPWVPLQSLSAAASRESLNDGADGGFAKQSHRAARTVRLRIRFPPRARGSGVESSSPQRSKPVLAAKPDRSKRGLYALNRSEAEASVRLCPLPRRTACTRTARSELHQLSDRSPSGGASSKRQGRSKPELPRRNLPVGVSRPKQRVSVGALSRQRARRVAEATRPTRCDPESCLPPVRHRSDESMQDTQRGNSTTPPNGVRSPSAFEPRRSSCRFASPTPSALRVSHPRSGLIPPGPCGFVSRHIHPWGLLLAFRAFPTQPAVTPLDAPCSLAVAADSGFSRASSRWAVAPAFGCPLRPKARRLGRDGCSCIPSSELRHHLEHRFHRGGVGIERAAETAAGVIAMSARHNAVGSR